MSDWKDQQIEEASRALVDYYNACVGGEVSGLLKDCESPIEEVLAVWLLYRLRFDFELAHCQVFFGEALSKIWPLEFTGDGIGIYQQASVDRYRVDFLICGVVGEKVAWVVVECDGHDFHERTKEQAKRDRSRDRWMTLHDITVLRFTGAEIYENAESCAAQVSSMLEKALLDG